MRESVRYFLARTAKWGAVGSLGVILVIVAAHFVLKRPAAVEPKAGAAPQATAPGAELDRKEGIEHVIFKGDRGKIKVKADKFYAGDDKLDHLEGNVEVVDYGQTGGQELTVTADKVDYDQDLTFFKVSGGAKVRDKDSVFESSAFDYDKTREIVRTDQGVVFTSNRLDARARNFLYKKRAATLEFGGDVAIELRPRLATSFPLSVRGQSFIYRRKAKSGRIDGSVRMTHGKSRGSADTLVFLLSDDEQQVKALSLTGSAVATFFRDAAGESGGAGQDIRADEIRMVVFPDAQVVSRLKAKGGCVLKLELEAGAQDEIMADTVVIYFDRLGELKDFTASGSARMSLGGGKDAERRVRGDSVVYAKKSDVLKADGGAKAPARIDSDRTEVEASSISVGMGSGDMNASGGVKLVLKPVEDGRAVGFFSKDKPVFITCRDLTYAKEKKSFAFREDVRIWQEKDVVLAKEFDILEESGAVSGRGGVKASFTHKPKDKPAEERLEIAADLMNYVPRSRKIAFEGSCGLTTAALRMTSTSLDVRLKDEGSEMDRLLARGKVVIIQEGKEGRGEDAIYDLKADTVVLTGNPVLIDKEKGVTEGDKLTFHLGDGRITIENKERDRSATVIKS
jgi:lipopolysaccharide export system protein LptA